MIKQKFEHNYWCSGSDRSSPNLNLQPQETGTVTTRRFMKGKEKTLLSVNQKKENLTAHISSSPFLAQATAHAHQSAEVAPPLPEAPPKPRPARAAATHQHGDSIAKCLVLAQSAQQGGRKHGRSCGWLRSFGAAPERSLESSGLARLSREVVDLITGFGRKSSPGRPPQVRSNRVVLTHSRSPSPRKSRPLSFGSGTPGSTGFSIWKTCNSHSLGLD